jgi:hypothetical protein
MPKKSKGRVNQMNQLKTLENILYSLWYEVKHNRNKYSETHVREARHFKVPDNVINYVKEQASNGKNFYFQTWPTTSRMIDEAYAGKKSFDEFFLSKVAFLSGYTNVYYNEFGPKQEIATPGKWISDDTVVSDFANEHGLERVSSDSGDHFLLEGEELQQFMENFKEEITKAMNYQVDDLLSEYKLEA